MDVLGISFMIIFCFLRSAFMVCYACRFGFTKYLRNIYEIFMFFFTLCMSVVYVFFVRLQ